MVSAPAAPTTPLEWVRAGLLALTMAWSVLALGGHPPLAFLVSLGLTLAVALSHVAVSLRGTDGALRVPWPVLAFVPFLAWAAASAAWVSDAGWIGWTDWLRWTQGVVLFWVAGQGLRTPGTRRLLLGTFAGVAIVSVLFACHQVFLDPTWLVNGAPQLEQFRGRASGPFFAPTTFAGFLVLLIPVASALAVRAAASGFVRVAAGWLAGVLVFGLVLPVSRGGWLALVGATALWFVASTLPGRAQRVARASATSLGLVVLAWLLLAASPSTRERFEQLLADRGEVTRPVLWRAAWDIFTAHPLFGSGGGSYNVAFEAVRPEGFVKDPIWAHSEYLNLLSDYGVVGALLAVFAAFATFRSLRPRAPELAGGRQRVSDWSDASALGTGIRVGLLALGLHAAVDFHFRLPGIVVAVAVLAGLAVRGPASGPEVRGWKVPRVLTLALAVGAVALLALEFGPLLRGESYRREGRRWVDGLWGVEVTVPRYAVDLALAESRLRAATGMHAANAQAWSDLAYVLTLRSHVEPTRSFELGLAAEVAANHALRLGPGLWEPWLRRSVARDLQGRWFEAGDDSATALSRAPANADVWYYHAYHLSHRRNERFIALAAAEFCLRLDPQNREAQALRLRLGSGDHGPR